MTELEVFRTNVSAYQGDNFRELEGKLLNKIGVKYTEKLNNPNILITNTHTDLKEYDLSRLKLIVHPNSGYDNFPVEIVNGLSCPIVIGHTIRAEAVANYTISALMQHYSQIPNHKSWSKTRTWKRKLLSEVTVQLIGYGHIGEKVESFLKDSVNKVNIYDPHKGLNCLKLSDADVIIFAAGLNETSHHLLNEKLFSELKSDVLIINGARGALIDTKSLFAFLAKNKESYAFIDVFENEPYPIEDLELENICTTSHIAGVFSNLNEEILNFSYKVISDFIANSDNFSTKYKNEILQNKIINGMII